MLGVHSVAVHLQLFFTWVLCFVWRGCFGAERHLPDLQCQQGSSAALCIADSPSSDLGNRGPTSCFYLSPLIWEVFNQTPSSTPQSFELSLGVVLTLEEGLLVSLLGFYTDFLRRVAVEAFSFTPQYTDCAVESVVTSVVCIWETRGRTTNLFLFNSLKKNLKGQCLCECRCV